MIPAKITLSVLCAALLLLASVAPGSAKEPAWLSLPPTATPKAHSERVPDGAQKDVAAPLDDVFAIGDTLRVSFYEELDLGSGESGAGAALTTFYQRVDLTGDYEIDPRGQISIPTLGAFAIGGRSVDRLEADISDAFTERTGRSGSVHVRIVSRQPIYVLGTVRNPGAYAYAPGMVALQAVALSGGLDRAAEGSDRMLNARREEERRATAEERLKRLLARQARLEAERDDEGPTVSPRLAQLAGAREALEMIDAEARMGQNAAAARKGEIALQEAKVETARGELATLRMSLDSIDTQISARSQRVAELEAVQSRGFGNTEILSAARREVSDHELSQRRVLGEIHRAERALAEAEIARERVVLDARAQVERELMEVGDEIAVLEHMVRSASEIRLALLDGAPPAPALANGFDIEIVRRSTRGTSALVADEYTELKPGDVVNVLTPARRAPGMSQAFVEGRPM